MFVLKNTSHRSRLLRTTHSVPQLHQSPTSRLSSKTFLWDTLSSHLSFRTRLAQLPTSTAERRPELAEQSRGPTTSLGTLSLWGGCGELTALTPLPGGIGGYQQKSAALLQTAPWTLGVLGGGGVKLAAKAHATLFQSQHIKLFTVHMLPPPKTHV